MKKTTKRNNSLIIGILVAVLLLMGAGYAALSTSLNIGATSNIDSRWNIHITDVTATPTGKATDVEHTHDGLTARFQASLPTPGDSITYEIDVKNDGNVDAYLEDINKTVTISNTDMISASITGFTNGEMLLAGQTKTIVVTLTFKDGTYDGVFTQAETARVRIELLFSQ